MRHRPYSTLARDCTTALALTCAGVLLVVFALRFNGLA